MFSQPDNINLACYILHELVAHTAPSDSMQKGNIVWDTQILTIEEKTTDETLAHMKSLVGAFDHAAVVGTCLTSGWFEHNVDILLDDKNPTHVQSDIAQFSHLITEVIHKKVHPIRPTDKRTKEQLVVQGFQLGLDLGRCLNNMTPYAPLTGIKMREMLELIKSEPTLVMHGKKPLTPAFARAR